MGKQPFVFLLLLLFASTVFCSESQQYRFIKSFQLAASDDEKIQESIEVVVTTVKEMENVLAVLPQNNLLTTAKTILNSFGIIGDFMCFGLNFFVPQDDPITKKMDEMTGKLVEKFKEIGDKIDKGINELKTFIEENKFEEKVTFLVNQLMGHISLFYIEKTPSLKHKLNQTCQEFSVESIFINMKTLLNSKAITNILKHDEYSEQAFERIESLYKNMMKQLLIAYPICETLVYGVIKDENAIEKRNEHIIKLVAEIEEKLKEENEKRIKAFKQIHAATWESREAFQDLKSRVEDYKKRPGSGWEVTTLYGTTKCGEHFAIFVTRTVWTYVQLFTQETYKLCGIYYGKRENENWMTQQSYWTPSGGVEVAREWKNLLEDGDYVKVLHYEQTS